jgi:hypothetical protein
MEATSSLYKGHRYPVEIISHCVWLYHRFPLSLREVEEMMMARGVLVTYETIPQWGPQVRSNLREPATSPGGPGRGIGGSGAGAMTTTGGRSRSLMFLRFPARLSHYGGHGW